MDGFATTMRKACPLILLDLSQRERAALCRPDSRRKQRTSWALKLECVGKQADLNHLDTCRTRTAGFWRRMMLLPRARIHFAFAIVQVNGLFLRHPRVLQMIVSTSRPRSTLSSRQILVGLIWPRCGATPTPYLTLCRDMIIWRR